MQFMLDEEKLPLS